ncbi:MAG: hypothetical protein IJK66_02570 [Bacilli bacterium]|nr:hypothetical protein [Bacilli bacterium]
MPRELFEKLKEYLEKKRIAVAVYNANIEAAKMLESSSKVQEYLRLCGVKSVVSNPKDFNKYSAFAKFIEENDIKDTNGLIVYCGTYIEESYYDVDSFQYEKRYTRVKKNNPDATCREYWDIEKKNSITIPIEACEEFESTHKVISLSLVEARGKFLDMSLQSGQEEATKELCKKYRLK